MTHSLPQGPQGPQVGSQGPQVGSQGPQGPQVGSQGPQGPQVGPQGPTAANNLMDRGGWRIEVGDLVSTPVDGGPAADYWWVAGVDAAAGLVHLASEEGGEPVRSMAAGEVFVERLD